jgi:hypothetical protein
VAKRMHPDGMARLIAVIVAPTDKGPEIYCRAVDAVQDRILVMARQYYTAHDQDFDDATGWVAPRNGLQNLAKLNRRNLLPKQ